MIEKLHSQDYLVTSVTKIGKLTVFVFIGIAQCEHIAHHESQYPDKGLVISVRESHPYILVVSPSYPDIVEEWQITFNPDQGAGDQVMFLVEVDPVTTHKVMP